jgi:hypothetical protein
MCDVAGTMSRATEEEVVPPVELFSFQQWGLAVKDVNGFDTSLEHS